jgi:hypothetical protein
MAIWKDKSTESSTNTALPQSIPMTEDIPDITTPTEIQTLTKEVFQAPEPDLPNEQITPMFQAPEPTEDLSSLYEQIKDLEEEDKKES